MVKQLRQVAGVESVKVVDFKKGIFAVTPRRGATLSESVLLQAARRSGFTPERVVAPAGASEKKTSSPPRPATSDERGDADRELAAARQAFGRGDYNQALKLAREVAGKMPPKPSRGRDGDTPQKNAHDAEVRQFLSLVYFALAKYDEASTAAHVALHRGPHWTWKRLSGQYAKTEDYTRQLRALEKYVREHPASAESRFLLGYHYLMLGYTKAARSHLGRVAEQRPDDKLVRQLLQPLKKEGSQTSSK